ncbi:MAG: exo-alpha-sialidase [Verrucomicrobia bacterium]|nr:exo-alpha-sialidase [Verrucomicrobiota bacterium]
MKRILLFITLSSSCMAEHWPLDAVDSKIAVLGKAKVESGARDKSLVLDGVSLIELKETAALNGESGFTFSVWFNPYAVNEGQQIIAGKNRYSLNERQWSLTVEPDGKLKAYVQQGGWATLASKETLKAGHWHLATLTVDSGKAALYLNGQQVGEVKLKASMPHTQAPITLGGINDNGRRTQTFSGAVDEARFVTRALSAQEIAASYKPVTATHEIPKAAIAATPLWDEKVKLPRDAELPVLEGVEFHVIKKKRPDTDGCNFTLGVGLAWHKGRLYASYAYNKGTENTPTEEAHTRVSDDGGKTWGPPVVIDAGDGDLAVSHGVFLSHGGKLWAFMGAFYAHTRLYHRVHARGYLLNETAGAWEPQGAVVNDGFWPMQEPLKMADGNWIMAGFRISDQYGQSGNLPAVAISKGDDFTKWSMVVIPAAPNLGTIWGESTVIVEGKRILNISRYGKKALALLSVSEDHGRTWTPSAPSNLPMATSKPYAGILSTGQRYLVCTTTADTGGRRSPLTIAVSKPGESVFSKVFLVRRSIFPEGHGVSAPNIDFSYPYAIEHDGKLYIGYTHKSHVANELAVIPITRLH